MMSVFAEFHKAWRTRFPGKELPSAWEEDVRANLAKHRARAAVLREDLEKEQFYVEYLERLVEDVQQHSRGGGERGEGEGAPTPYTCMQDHVDETINSVLAEHSQNQLRCSSPSGEDPSGEEGDDLSPAFGTGGGVKQLTRRFNKNANPSSRNRPPAFMRSTSVPASSANPPASGANHRHSTCEPSTFVTVIPISGEGEGNCDPSASVPSVGGKVGRRKSPPIVPPKTFRQRPPSLGEPPEPRPPAPLPHQCLPPLVSPADGVEPWAVQKSSSLSSNGSDRPTQYLCKKSSTSSVASIRRPATPPVVHSDNSDGEEPLYDTVAPDEDEEESPFDTLKSGDSGGSLASKSGCSGGGLSSPSGSPAPHDLPPIDSPKHRNYVNLDFFLKRQRKGLTVPEADDSEEEDEDEDEDEAASSSSRGLLRSLSSDHEDEDSRDDVAQDIDSGVYGSSVESTSHMPSAPDRSPTLASAPPSSPTITTNNVRTNNTGINNNNNNNNNNNTATSNNSSSSSFGHPIVRHVSNISSSSNSTDLTNTTRSKNSVASTNSSSINTTTAATTTTAANNKSNRSNSNKSNSSDSSLSSSDKSVGGGRRWASLSDVAEDPVLAEAQHLTMCRCITASILESENVYLECLQVVLQYMKALKATLTTSQPVISPDDFSTVFYRIPELYAAHKDFLEGLREHAGHHTHSPAAIGDLFQALAQKLDVYGQFLSNYSRAVDTVRRCSSESPQFSAITRAIKLKSHHGQPPHTLEELLHRPVARVQKNALVLHDLLKHTPEQDSGSLQEALRLFQNFLTHFSMIHSDAMFPMCDRPQRHLVRNSFIVELVDGHRKLRHLFLFNDVLLCAKYKATNRADKFTFDLKWFISLHDILILESSSLEQFREASPPNLVNLKSQAATVRDQLRRLEGSSEGKGSTNTTGTTITPPSAPAGGLLLSSRVDKLRKRLSELEAQLILASPSLPWRVGRRGSGSGAHNTFLLSSQYERQQWTEAVNVLQNNSPGVGGSSLTAQELQSWITSYRSFLKTNMGNFLLRSGRDEPLLLGDLHIVVNCMRGLRSPAAMHLCFEVDSYGHFFRKAKTRQLESEQPDWNQDFIIELEGSQTLRVLCYEDTPGEGIKLRGKAEIDLSTSWLSDSLQERTVALQELHLSLQLKYLPPEATLRRVPTAKPHGLFGAPISVVCKREKRSVPFVVTRCVREVERRGVAELGIYRVSGMTSDISRLKKSFESNPYEAEQLIKEVDIHSVTGLLKLYLRELPEALYTNEMYPRFYDACVSSDHEYRRSTLLTLFSALPQLNQSIIVYLLEHLVKVHKLETINKMTLHNLATVFGPTVVRPAQTPGTPDPAELLAAGTVDVMAQAGILHFFLDRRARGEPIQAGSGC